MNEEPSGEPSRPVRPKLLTSKEVAAALQVSSATLSRWRQTGHGPRVVWLTPYAPRYRPEDVKVRLARSAA